MGNCVSNSCTQELQPIYFKKSDKQQSVADVAQPTISVNDGNPAVSRSIHTASIDIAEDSNECIKLFNDIKVDKDVDALILLIEKLLQRKMSSQQNNSVNAREASTSSQEPHQMEEERFWTSFTDKGSKFLNYMKGLLNKEGFHQGIKAAAEILKEVAAVNSILAWLSIVGYLLSTSEKEMDNQTECLNILRSMINLAKHVKRLENTISDDKFNNAIELIVKGSITCYSQLKSHKMLRTLIATVNSEGLRGIRREIKCFIGDLTLTVVTNIDEHTPRYVPPEMPVYPHHAVGIEEPVKQILGWLKDTENSLLAVVIYGVGGIGKSTVATAVAAKMNLRDFNFTPVIIYQEKEKNNITKLQQQILRDCFPTYNSGRQIDIRNCEEGRAKLTEAFKCKESKPIFLYIDNASRSHDLLELLPEDLSGLPQGSRILVTTRNLAATSMFKQRSLVHESYRLMPLHKDEAQQILLRDPSERGALGDERLGRILKICSGVPLALKIFYVQLHKKNEKLTRCDRLLDTFETGGEIKAEQLSDRLLEFVYADLEEYSQEAFLDICCFFSNWKRQDVEYIVGEEAIISLLETGLITLIKHDDSSTMYFKGEEELVVHEIIAAKGRRLAKDNRITSFESFSEAVDDEKLSGIKGVWLTGGTSIQQLEEEELKLMRKSLRVLALGERVTVSGACSEKFEKLNFLHIGGSITQLPVKLEALNKLTVFHGPFSLKGEVTLCKLPSSLLAMKVTEQSDDMESEDSDMEGALQCSQLEKLHFTGLRRLRKLPEGINSLYALKTLVLDDFSTMESQPEPICQLRASSVVSITKSSALDYLPESFGQLSTNLQQLRLSDFLALKELPPTLGQFGALTHLDLEGCHDLQTLPENIELLTSLTHLSLNRCKNLEALPRTFGGLTALKYLNLTSCEMLQALPPTFGNLSGLKYLYLTLCKMLEVLPDNFRQLTALEYLNLCCCRKLEILPFSLEELTALKRCVCSPELRYLFESEARSDLLVVVNEGRELNN